jgi:hypothetical protein
MPDFPAGDEQKHDDGDDKSAVVGDAEHDWVLSGERASLRWNFGEVFLYPSATGDTSNACAFVCVLIASCILFAARNRRRAYVLLRVPRPLRGLLLDLRKTHTPRLLLEL